MSDLTYTYHCLQPTGTNILRTAWNLHVTSPNTLPVSPKQDMQCSTGAPVTTAGDDYTPKAQLRSVCPSSYVSSCLGAHM